MNRLPFFLRSLAWLGCAVALMPLTCCAEGPLEADNKSSVVKSSEADAPADARGIIEAIMEDQYGKNYDKVHQCWAFIFKSDSGEEMPYCMHAGNPKVVTLGNGERDLYLLATNVENMSGDPRYRYSHADSGILGAFKVKLEDHGKWSYLASNKSIAEGSMGSCGCKDAKFIKFSNKGDYGWLFSSGGTWQGTIVLNYSIIVSLGKTFEDVSSIPEVTEGRQDVKYLIDVDSSGKSDGLYPLAVTETKGGIKQREYVVNFDPKTQQYSLPDSSQK